MSLMVTSRCIAPVRRSWAKDLKKTGRIRKPAAAYPTKRITRAIETFLHMIGHHPGTTLRTHPEKLWSGNVQRVIIPLKKLCKDKFFDNYTGSPVKNARRLW
jgi:hypothetical protein